MPVPEAASKPLKPKEHDMKQVFLPGLLLALIVGCTPTVRVEAPDKPIEINLNVKIDHEIRIKVDKDLDNLFKNQSDIF